MSGMIKKIKSNWLAIGLTTVVIISLVLTGLIWLSPMQYERTRETSNSSLSTPQSIGDLYLPTQVIHTDDNQHQYQLYSSRKNTISDIRSQLKKTELGRVSLIKQENSDVFLSYLHQRNSVIINYTASITSTIFNETFSQTLDTSKIKQVDHILIPLKDARYIYLLNDEDYKIYRVKVGQTKVNTKIASIIKGTKTIPVDYKLIQGQPLVLYPKGFSLPVFGYQVTKQNVDTLSQNLLSTSKQSSLRTERSDNKTIYRNGENKRIVYNHNTGNIRYDNYLSQSDVPKTNQLYSYFFNQIAKTGIPMDNLRYDDISKNRRTISFRSYVEGFPIYSENGYGTVKISSSLKGTNKTWMNIYNIQVPLPIAETNVKLPSTTTIFNQLRAENRLKDVNGIRIGYLWKNSVDNNSVVKLVPTYLINYRGEWINYEDLQK